MPKEIDSNKLRSALPLLLKKLKRSTPDALHLNSNMNNSKLILRLYKIDTTKLLPDVTPLANKSPQFKLKSTDLTVRQVLTKLSSKPFNSAWIT